MIKVTVELISAVDESRNKILGIGYIANDGNMSYLSDGKLGNYHVKLTKMEPQEKVIWKEGTVCRFPRKKRGAWDLLYLALKNIVGDRNPCDPPPKEL